MPTPIDSTSPEANKASRSTNRDLGTSVTAVAATDVFTLAGGVLDALDQWAPVKLRGSLSGGAGLAIGQEYWLSKISSTTFRLSAQRGGPAVDVTSDLTGTTAILTYGRRAATDGRFDDIL